MAAIITTSPHIAPCFRAIPEASLGESHFLIAIYSRKFWYDLAGDMRAPGQLYDSATRAKLDNQAIADVRGGDGERFQELVERYHGQIISLIARQVGDRSIAEELAQEVFIRAYRGLSGFKGDSGFGTWLTRIAINHSNSYFASKQFKQRKRSESFEPVHHDRGQAESDGEDQELAELKERFREALQQLRPIYRETLVLCGIEGKQYQEAAEILGVPVGTIRSRLNKARQDLQQYLGVISRK